MERKFLTELGLEKEDVDTILNQHGAEIAALKTQIGNKDAEIKAVRDDLVAANTRIADLEKVDVEALKKQLEDERDKRVSEKRGYAVQSLFEKAGCQDVDYVVFKLGDSIEFDDEDSIKNPEALLTTAKENFKHQFSNVQPNVPRGTGKGSVGEETGLQTERQKLEVAANDKTLPLAQRVAAREKLYTLKEE